MIDTLGFPGGRTAGFSSATEGACSFVPEGARTRVRYEITVEPGFYVPPFILDFALSEGLPRLLESVRRRAESQGGTLDRASFGPDARRGIETLARLSSAGGRQPRLP